MAAAAVALGLLPITLSLVGSSTAEIGLLALRRPILTFFLASGAPAVSSLGVFEYQGPIHMLREGLRESRACLDLMSPVLCSWVFL
ncbi:hypothetical protein RRF57_006684 [Xylaria bambusicola]|uniref:Uncharacterized protein n=1 Tax=Xylaria bambusicola TaxID=326684 RepID=A0AAN7UPA3_9PEZI